MSQLLTVLHVHYVVLANAGDGATFGTTPEQLWRADLFANFLWTQGALGLEQIRTRVCWEPKCWRGGAIRFSQWRAAGLQDEPAERQCSCSCYGGLELSVEEKRSPELIYESV